MTSGFTLLIAIVVTSIMLLISFVISNVALKQTVLSKAGTETQYAFYAADSGTDCALYWDLKDSSVSAFSTTTASTIYCNGQTISTGSQTIATNPQSSSVIGGGGNGNATSTFQLNFARGCAIVRIGKQYNGTTNIDSRGYNTCNTSAIRRYERGINLSYQGNTTTQGGGFAGAVPTVASPTVSTITSSGATLGANVTSLGIPAAITSRGTCWAATPNPVVNCSAEGGTSLGAFTHARSGMSNGVLYYYRGYAVNSTGTGYSADGTFTTGAVSGDGSGGTITDITVGPTNYRVHRFTSSGTFVAPTAGVSSVEYVVVGGGGGGSRYGGGGAGGFRSGSLAVSSGQSIPVTVGGGGAGTNGTGAATDGSNSIFSSITSLGGGGAGGDYTGAPPGAGCGPAARTGGSGGGGGAAYTTGECYVTHVGAAGTGGQGSNGGNGAPATGNVPQLHGGGGGGASAVGAAGTAATGGAGGAGTASSITGSSVNYAGGGGGSGQTAGGNGGSGGGGNGGISGVTLGSAGTANRGGGGGGSGIVPNAGGSGVVIIRYVTN